MGVSIEKIGKVELERTGENKMTDKYHVRFTGSDAPDHTDEHERDVNGRKIGCPNCKQNAFAFFRNGEYRCAICLNHARELKDKHIRNGYFKTSRD